MTTAEGAVARTAATRRRADEWALVLQADGLAPRIERHPHGYAVVVPASQQQRAASALDAFDLENEPARARLPESPRRIDLPAGIAFALALALAYLATSVLAPGQAAFSNASAVASRIRAGELFRTLTALTLHADAGHLAGNALAGGLFASVVCGALGPGVGLASILAAGGLGNLANAWLRQAPHDSVGASTAVFGALGVLCGLSAIERHRGGLRGLRFFLPLAAGLGILGMLGTAGERTDLWAHAFGLLAGIGLGLPLALALPHAPGPRTQLATGVAAALCLAAAWASALR